MPKKDDAPKPVYSFRVKGDVEGGSASFVADGQAIDLSPQNPVYETTNPKVAAGLRDLWFLTAGSD